MTMGMQGSSVGMNPLYLSTSHPIVYLEASPAKTRRWDDKTLHTNGFDGTSNEHRGARSGAYNDSFAKCVSDRSGQQDNNNARQETRTHCHGRFERALVRADPAMDDVFAHHEQQWITKPEFTSPLVDHLPVSTTVPSPRDVLGDDIGAPRVLHYYADILKYYRALAEKSPRVKIIPTGKTEEGRETVIVLISSDENIRNLDANRQNLAKLADPRSISEAQAHEIISQTKPMYVVLGGLHSLNGSAGDAHGAGLPARGRGQSGDQRDSRECDRRDQSGDRS